MKTITLQSRIIVILTTFSLITVAVFITVQLAHEINIVNRHLQNRANIVSLAIGNTWEKITTLTIPYEKKIELLQKKVGSLKDSKEIVKAYLLNKEGQIIYSTEGESQDKTDFYDLRVINQLNNEEPLEEEPIIDASKKTFSLYVALTGTEENKFILRIFFSLADLKMVIEQVYSPALMIGFLLILINIILGIFLSRLIIEPIKIFNKAAKVIAAGRLDLRVNLSTNDELEELADTFNFMTKELVKMKERAENANPLTKLPGNIVIKEEVEKKIREGKQFTVIYCDLDNFKAFNDKYGIAKGDEAIKLTGDIFKEAIKIKGGPGDFIGHEGGDDFILVTTPSLTTAITEYIISEFDKRIRSLYTQEDLGRGFIIAHARDNSLQQFPIMTISLAGVTNEYRPITTYAEVTNIAAEVKKKAKSEKGSCFILDRRKE
jgi:diguanylate cyclase (GGDEF)-like protein